MIPSGTPTSERFHIFLYRLPIATTIVFVKMHEILKILIIINQMENCFDGIIIILFQRKENKHCLLSKHLRYFCEF